MTIGIVYGLKLKLYTFNLESNMVHLEGTLFDLPCLLLIIKTINK